MTELQSSLHLVQPPLYRGEDNTWQRNYLDAVRDYSSQLTWEPAAFLSINSFSYVCGDRTLLQQIRRRSWLSDITEGGRIHLEDIPGHGRVWKSYEEITNTFIDLLCDEAEIACRNRDEVYILLSGGLDSRVVAGIVARCIQQKRISSQVTAVTWGPADCRDVVYARQIAELLKIDWNHIDFRPEHVLENVEWSALYLGSLVSPVHLHRMAWFQNVSPDALVLAGSYGDMVGRAEFSGRHLLEHNYLHPTNPFGLIRRGILPYAYENLKQDLNALHARSPNEPRYVICEHEQSGHYMRSHINHAMCLIDQYCTLYQMFTHPKVYSFIWSLHPALRFDDIYEITLGKIHSDLPRFPWARTNRSLRGKVLGARSDLQKSFHDYCTWIAGPVWAELRDWVDPDWFAETEIFDPQKVRYLIQLVKDIKTSKPLYNLMPYERWLWLAAVRRFAEHLEAIKKDVKPPNYENQKCPPVSLAERNGRRKWLRYLVKYAPSIMDAYHKSRRIRQRFRKKRLRRRSIRKFPPLRETS